MTHIRYEWLVKHKKDQAEDDRRAVLNAVVKLRKVTAIQVKNYLDLTILQDAKLEAQKKYENGNISSKEKIKEEKKYIKKYSRVLRTVQRWLKCLAKEGYLIRKGREFSMAEKGLHYIRFFIRGFGKRPLSDLCNNPILSQSLEEYIQKFVQAFGVYLLYTFIQMRRINGFDWLTKEEKNEIRLSFFENGIAMTKMFDLFSKTLANTDVEELTTALKNQYKLEYTSFQAEWDYLYEGLI
jgi:hypothetical protein